VKKNKKAIRRVIFYAEDRNKAQSMAEDWCDRIYPGTTLARVKKIENA
jgi:hypothetical protein